MDPSAKRRRSEENCALVKRLLPLPQASRALVLRARIELALQVYARDIGRVEAVELAYQLGDGLLKDPTL